MLKLNALEVAIVVGVRYVRHTVALSRDPAYRKLMLDGTKSSIRPTARFLVAALWKEDMPAAEEAMEQMESDRKQMEARWRATASKESLKAGEELDQAIAEAQRMLVGDVVVQGGLN